MPNAFMESHLTDEGIDVVDEGGVSIFLLFLLLLLVLLFTLFIRFFCCLLPFTRGFSLLILS